MRIRNISVGYSSSRQHIEFLLLLVDTKHFCWILFKTTTYCVSTSTCRYEKFILDILQYLVFLLLLVDTKHFCWIFFNILRFYFYLSIQNISVGYSSRRQHIVSHFLLVDTKHVCWIFFKMITDCVSTSTC